jgi:hypothetical protein
MLRQRPHVPPPPRGGPRRVTRRRATGIAILAALIAAVLAFLLAVERDVWMASHRRVPSLLGRTVSEAAQMAVPLHFGVIVAAHRQDPHAPIGVILAQKPLPGAPRPKGSIIQLTISQGSGIIPPLRGTPVTGAAQQLEAVGLRLGRVHYLNDGAPPGTVLEQFTPPGWQVGANSQVDVLVSQGPMEFGKAAPGSPAPPEPAVLPGPPAPSEPAASPVPVPLASPGSSEHSLPAASSSRYGPRVADHE